MTDTMQEAANNLQEVSTNLTTAEFKGFCKGMSIKWIIKAVDEKDKYPRAHLRVKFWDNAYEKYKHNCS